MLERTKPEPQPLTAREHKDRGAVLLAQGQTQAALNEYQAALADEPGDLSLRRKVADLFARLGRPRDAIHAYQGLVARFAVDGKLTHAIALCKVILQLDPKHTQTQEFLAALYSKRTQSGHWTAQVPAALAGALDLSYALRESQPAPKSSPAEEEELGEVDIDLTALPEIPLFSDLPREVFLALLDMVQAYTAKAGEAIVREGDPAESMFVLCDGTAKVVRAWRTPAEKMVDGIVAGSFFGEIGLMTAVPRLASVVADTDCSLLEVTRANLGALFVRFPDLQGIVTRFYKQRLIANFLRSNRLFASFTAAEMRTLADVLALETQPAQTTLIREGEPGRALFVLLRGRCSVSQRDEAGGQSRLPDLTEGAIFGEISLSRLPAATANVWTEGECLLLVLDRDSFQEHFMANPAVARAVHALAEERLQRSQALLAQTSPRPTVGLL